MEATQILMMPVTGIAPTVSGEQGIADSIGNPSAEQFGALLGQVLESLQSAGARLAAVPALESEAGLLAPDLPVPLEGQAGDAGAEVMAQLLGGYQQMLSMQQGAVVGMTETERPGDSLGDDIAVVSSELPETVGGEQRLPATTGDNVPVVSTEDISNDVAAAKLLESSIPPAESQEEAHYRQHMAGQTPMPLKPVTAMASDDETGKQYGEPVQQAGVSQLHSRKLQTELPVQNQGQVQIAERQADELAEQGRMVVAPQASSYGTGPKAEDLPLSEVRAVPATHETGGKSSNQPVAQFRFAQPADVAIAADAAGNQNDTASGFGAEGREAGRQFGDASAGQSVMEQGALELHDTPALPTKHADPILPGAQASKIAAAEPAVAAEVSRPVQQEQITRQVSERLSGYEVKPGADHLSLKLSPEHLGNLQLTFKMEDQRLKLEIVTENRGVRDALLQQADDLKESLARQNIKVDSFDVTTANGNNMSQQQRDWRQMAAEQHQYQPQFMTSRSMVDGTRPEAAVRYFAPQYNSTIDVRF